MEPLSIMFVMFLNCQTCLQESPIVVSWFNSIETCEIYSWSMKNWYEERNLLPVIGLDHMCIDMRSKQKTEIVMEGNSK